jgi:hypothetical protein
MLLLENHRKCERYEGELECGQKSGNGTMFYGDGM